MDRRLVLATDFVLVAAIVLDVVLCSLTWIAPEMWFETLHGTANNEPFYAFLRRCGAHWAAFAVFQAVALVRWRGALHWLVLVAGMRFSDLFTDLTYLASSHTMTTSGAISLMVPVWLNLGMGLLLMLAFHKAVGAERVAGLKLAAGRS